MGEAPRSPGALLCAAPTCCHHQQKLKSLRRDPVGFLGAGRGCGCLREPRASCDTCATTRREQRLTGLAVFILTGVSVFMAPVLKVRKAAAVLASKGFLPPF